MNRPDLATTNGAGPSSAAAVQVQGLKIRFGQLEIVRSIDLEIRKGEIVTLLGPSGCGKTTTLRAIAGFVTPWEGRIRLHGNDVTDLPPNKRNVGMVFQGYALFPHLTAFDNVAYGLRIRKVPRPELERRVRRALEMVKLEKFADRKPSQLSGGQQQRVAIARALVIEPEILLLDEPLSNLDAKLRHEMQTELRRLLKELDIAAVFVTHDQEEAIALSDWIVLMNEGNIEQMDTPQAMYQQPRTLFTAAFLGQANFLEGRVVEQSQDGTAVIEIGGNEFRGMSHATLEPGKKATMVVKCERIGLEGECEGRANRIDAHFASVSFLGMNIKLETDFEGQRVVALLPASRKLDALKPDQSVGLCWEQGDCLVFPAS